MNNDLNGNQHGNQHDPLSGLVGPSTTPGYQPPDLPGSAQPQGQQQAQSQQELPLSGRVVPSTALQDSIAQKRRQVIELERKIETHRETGAYERVFGPGSDPIFDKTAMDEDIVRIGRLNREIADLERQQQRAEVQGNERLAMAKQLASQLAKREMPAVDEPIRNEVANSFVMLFNSMAGQGEFNKAIYSERRNVEALLNQMWENAWGNAVRRQRTGGAQGQQNSQHSNQGGQMPAATGFDGSDVQREPQPPQRNEDPYTNNVMLAYENIKKKKSLTYAEAKAAEREAERQRLMSGQSGQPGQPEPTR